MFHQPRPFGHSLRRSVLLRYVLPVGGILLLALHAGQHGLSL
jgi:hypothetical protein